MLIKVGYNLIFSFPIDMAAVLMLYLHPSRVKVRKPEQLRIEPEIPIKEYIDSFGNRCGHLPIPAGRLVLWNEAIVEDSGEPDIIHPIANQVSAEKLPPETLQFLLSSRYCEVDMMGNLAWSLFGHTAPGWPRVQAICDWVHNRIRFDYQHARMTRTAHEAYAERVGVCRDYTHLAIAFCRSMHIPARYVTGYLGDIGIPPCPLPMDFSSWMEVYLDGRWYTFDPRHNIPRIGHIPMAVGRDAADVALITSFGQNFLEKFEVWTYEVSEEEVESKGSPLNGHATKIAVSCSEVPV